MGYLFLFLALTFGIIKAYCGKRSSFASECTYDAVVINTVRMVCCIFISLVIILISRDASAIFGTRQMISISVLSGISTACFTVSWLLSVHTMAYMLVEVFVMGGTVIPLVLCAILYKESISIVQVAGIVLLLISVYCMCSYKKTDKVKITAKSFLLLLLCAISSGLSDFSQKLYIKETENADVSVFNLYTYVFAAIVLIFAGIVFRAKEKKECAKLPMRQ
jgi:drug/metabolite transporter (DMT)-like permease